MLTGSDWASPGISNLHWNWGSFLSIPPGGHHRGMSKLLFLVTSTFKDGVEWPPVVEMCSEWSHSSLFTSESHNLQLPCSRNKLALNFLLSRAFRLGILWIFFSHFAEGEERLRSPPPTPPLPPGYRSTKKLILLREDATLNSWIINAKYKNRAL